MLKKYIASMLVAAAFATPAFASGDHHGDANVARDFIKEMTKVNNGYAKKHGTKFFTELAKGQKPRVTVVSCSDSRVHTTAIDDTPEGDVFMIRDIGNQIATAHGSVQYGINHLGSSLLLVVGHSACGAIKAARGDYSSLEAPIKKELDTLAVPKDGEVIAAVIDNVNDQVGAAMKEWDEKVKKGELMIVGAVYDFSDDMKKGSGKLNIVNVNGETDAAKAAELLKPAKKAEHKH